jgi:undecaprenyl-diphosphatase
MKAQHLAAGATDSLGPIWPCVVGMVLSFAAGWLSLKWLSRWLEHGRWHLFGYYCLVAAAAVIIAGRLLPGSGG